LGFGPAREAYLYRRLQANTLTPIVILHTADGYRVNGPMIQGDLAIDADWPVEAPTLNRARTLFWFDYCPAYPTEDAARAVAYCLSDCTDPSLVTILEFGLVPFPIRKQEFLTTVNHRSTV
jgi:hypothetical protein